jgi:diguanylate cyclase (GGDEF)-like protein/PAS domain S-box-containing protein
LLDSGGGASFDEVVRLVSIALDCSIAIISLMDEHRQWFLAAHGLDVQETPREIALCNYPISLGEPFLVADAMNDERLDDHLMVRKKSNVRSYLGYPVRGPDGHILGVLCAADPQADKFDSSHIAVMEKLATLVEHLIAAHALSRDLSHTRHKLSEEQKRREHAAINFRQVERITKIGTWEIDFDNARLTWSEGIYAIYGHSPDNPIDLLTAIAYVAPDHRDFVRETIHQAFESGLPLDFETDIISRNGQRKRVHLIGEPLASEEMPRRLVGVLKDVTERHETHLALKRAAEIDELTGLPNRNAFTASLEAIIERTRNIGESRYLLMFDLDGLKEVNDIYGHAIGDDALREIGKRLQAAAGDGKSFARWGGDEFAVVLQGRHSHEDVRAYVGQVLDTITRAIHLPGKAIYLRATCGIAQSDGSEGARELVRRANQALHHGKTAGPGRAHFHDHSFEERNRARMAAELEVRAALSSDRIFAKYQPIIDLASGAVLGHEALLRIKRIDGEEIAAAELLPALIDPELSLLVAARMSELVSSDFAKLVAEGIRPGFVTINATEADLLSGDYPEMILSALARHGVPPERITVEVTETMLLVNDLERAKAVLDRLKAAGISIALDDFGTGFSSLTHLKDFPIDKVKIDRSFICDIVDDRNAQSIVAAVIAMAQRLSIDVIAEGIESEGQLAMLQSMGCPMGQGFLLSPPQPAGADMRTGNDAAPSIEIGYGNKGRRSGLSGC